jgi:hypothetical protein
VLRDIANLVLVMGNRDVIDGMAAGSAKVLDQVLKLIDAYDLYGRCGSVRLNQALAVSLCPSAMMSSAPLCYGDVCQ